MAPAEPASALNATVEGTLHGLFGMTYDEVDHGRAVNRLTVRVEFLGFNGFLHAATIVALAD